MKTIYTIGHSIHTIEQFLDLLKAYGAQQLVDVRTVPKSRYNPQFAQDMLAPALNEASIGYIHLKQLGGLRHLAKDSINTSWRNTSFRGYADYMATDGFQQGLEEFVMNFRVFRRIVSAFSAAIGIYKVGGGISGHVISSKHHFQLR